MKMKPVFAILMYYSILVVAGYGLIFDLSVFWMVSQTLAIVGFGLMVALLLFLPVLVWKAYRSDELTGKEPGSC